jgi:hypothetical protein
VKKEKVINMLLQWKSDLFAGSNGAVTLMHKDFAAKEARHKPTGVGDILLRHAGAISRHCALLRNVDFDFERRKSFLAGRNITGTNTQYLVIL